MHQFQHEIHWGHYGVPRVREDGNVLQHRRRGLGPRWDILDGDANHPKLPADRYFLDLHDWAAAIAWVHRAVEDDRLHGVVLASDDPPSEQRSGQVELRHWR